MLIYIRPLSIPTREMHVAVEGEGLRQGGKEIKPSEEARKGEVGPVVEVYPDEPTDPTQGPGPSIEPGRYADSPPDESGRHRKS